MKPTKNKVKVHGIQMSKLEEMYFAKHLTTYSIAMNTKTPKERAEIAQNWLNNHKSNQ